MLKLWGRLNSINVQKVVLCLEELALPYERIEAGLTFGVVNTSQYRALNPNGLVPTIEDDGLVLWESNTIVRYLCAARGEAIYPSERGRRADIEKWMDWQLSVLNPPVGMLFWGLVRAPGSRRAEDVEQARGKADAAMSIIDAHLADREWISGAAMGMADFVIAPYLHRWLHLPSARPTLPRLQAYYDRVMSRRCAKIVLTLPLT